MADPQAPEELWATLAGQVNEAMVQRVFQNFTLAMNNRVKRIHLLIQSAGGIIGDGIAIYNFLKNIPLEVIAYNGGFVQSVAVIAFLGAKKRRASKTATFMIHRAKLPTPHATSRELQAVAETVAIDDARMEGILRAHTRIPADRWEIHNYTDLHFTAEQALEYGVIDEIADFAPQLGAPIFNVIG